MERAKINVQDQVLNVSRKERVLVEIQLMGGEKIRGHIQSFDEYCIWLKQEDGKETMVYKHALISLTPQTPILLSKKELSKEGQ
jgi:host factor-I protein